MSFAFDLNSEVALRLTLQKGIVLGRAEYIDEPNLYLVIYVDVNLNQVKSWFKEYELLSKVEE